MSVFLRLEKISEEKAKIVGVHYAPASLSDIEKEGGVIVDTFVEEYIQGKICIPYWNYTTQSVEWEYTDKPLTLEQKLIIQEEKNVTLEAQLAQTNADMQGFMEYYFSTVGGV